MRYKIKVIANATRVEVIKLQDHPEWDLKVKLMQPANKNKANLQLLEVLADYFNISKSSIVIIRGETNSIKTIQINE